MERGEDVLKTLTSFCKENEIENGYLRGIGAVQWLECGYYELETKEYHFQEYDKMVEVVSMMGNIMLKENTPFLHVHAVFTDTTNNAFGGHVSEMKVGVIIDVLPSHIAREANEEIGLSLINCGG